MLGIRCGGRLAFHFAARHEQHCFRAVLNGIVEDAHAHPNRRSASRQAIHINWVSTLDLKQLLRGTIPFRVFFCFNVTWLRQRRAFSKDQVHMDLRQERSLRRSRWSQATRTAPA